MTTEQKDATRISELEEALRLFMKEAEFKRAVSGTMGHLTEAYENARKVMEKDNG